jgi:SSS family transporter
LSFGPFGPGAIAFVGFYFAVMVFFGLLARRRQEKKDLADFYLANRGIGAILLLLTLYATQYSGNNLIGFPGQAYRVGFFWVLSVGFMLSVIVGYLAYAPRLYRISRTKEFITPGDWIDHRFGSRALSLIASLVFLVTITNFLLAQLIAMGHAVSALSGEAVPYWAGVLGLGLIVVVYESIGGMRAVVWTDSAQAIMLLVGIVGMLIAVLPGIEHLAQTSTWIIENAPAKAAVPEGPAIRTWISTLVLVCFSASIYPQAIQRIFAAKSARTLRTSLSFMAFMPFLTTLPVFLVGILAIPEFQGLGAIEADEVMPDLIRMWAQQSTFLYLMAVLVLTGSIAAIMSTADSMLLSLSSIFAKDILAKNGLPHASPERLTRIGKLVSWLVILALMAFAVVPRVSLWGLIELKLEILLQAAPLFILGAAWRRFSAMGALAGLVVGVALAAGLSLAGVGKIWGFHAGVIAFALNVAIGVGVSLARPAR